MATDADGPLYARLAECDRRIGAWFALTANRDVLVRRILDDYLPRMVAYHRDHAAWQRRYEASDGTIDGDPSPADPRAEPWSGYDAALLVATADSCRRQRGDLSQPSPILDEESITADTSEDAVARRYEWRKVLRYVQQDRADLARLGVLVEQLEHALDRLSCWAETHLDANGSSAKPTTKHPALRLVHALNALDTVCANAPLFRELAEARNQSRQLRIDEANARLKEACDRRNARRRKRPSDPDEFPSLTHGAEVLTPPQTPTEPPAHLKILGECLESGRHWCQYGLEAIRAGGARLLDAELGRNAEGQKPSVELHTQLHDAEAAFGMIALGLRRSDGIIDNHVEKLVTLAKLFRRRCSELVAVIETRDLDAPAPTPTVSVSLDVVDRPQSAVAALELSAINRVAERAAAKAVEAMETRDAAGIGGADTDWKDVQGRLLRKRDRGEPYTSLRKLSAEFGCSDATIRKAIDASETLQGWQARSAGPKAAPKATDLGAVVRDNTRQTTEAAPHDVLPDDEVDATMARLIDHAKPDERAKLNALDDAGRRALVATYQAQNLDDELSPLEPDKPGGSRNVKQHKRA